MRFSFIPDASQTSSGAKKKRTVFFSLAYIGCLYRGALLSSLLVLLLLLLHQFEWGVWPTKSSQCGVPIHTPGRRAEWYAPCPLCSIDTPQSQLAICVLQRGGGVVGASLEVFCYSRCPEA